MIETKMNRSTPSSPATPTHHSVVPREQWLAKRKELLRKEKELTRLHDQLAAERQDMPWTRMDKDYLFDAPDGKVSLAELFAGRSQLVIYHFMFGPDWQEGCPSCSYVSDHINAALPHLAARDVTVTMVSRAPLAKIEPFKKRMGWRFAWVSSHDSDFNHDFHVSFTKEELAQGKVGYNYTLQEFPSEEAPGLSVFYRDAAGEIFHTYSSFGRGLETLLGTYMMLDLVPKGRDEDGLDFPMAWVRYHDRYDTNQFADADKPYWPETTSSTECGCASARAGRARAVDGAPVLPPRRQMGFAGRSPRGDAKMPGLRGRLHRRVHRHGSFLLRGGAPADCGAGSVHRHAGCFDCQTRLDDSLAPGYFAGFVTFSGKCSANPEDYRLRAGLGQHSLPPVIPIRG